MKLAGLAAVSLLTVLASCARAGGMQLHSSSFANDGKLSRQAVYNRAGCHGSNRSPQLRWGGVPVGTKSFALVVHDVDAPAPGGWYHWVAYNLPAALRTLNPGVRLDRGELGLTSWGGRTYGGPCPPPGKAHHYVFWLYALNVRRLDFSEPPSGAQLQWRMRGHILAKAALVGTYER